MNAELIRKATREHGGKMVTGATFTGVMVWVLMTCPTIGELKDSESRIQQSIVELKQQQREIVTSINELENTVIVLDALRRNEQSHARDIYE